VFTNRIVDGLPKLSGVDAQVVIATGATSVRNLITNPEKINAALEI